MALKMWHSTLRGCALCWKERAPPSPDKFKSINTSRHSCVLASGTLLANKVGQLRKNFRGGNSHSWSARKNSATGEWENEETARSASCAAKRRPFCTFSQINVYVMVPRLSDQWQPYENLWHGLFIFQLCHGNYEHLTLTFTRANKKWSTFKLLGNIFEKSWHLRVFELLSSKLFLPASSAKLVIS